MFSDKPVVQLRLQSSSDNSLSFTWSLLSEDSSNMFLQYYTLRYRTADTNSWKTAPKIPSDTTTYQLRGLKPYTDYAVELFATNKHFTSDPSRAKARTTEASKMSLGNRSGYDKNPRGMCRVKISLGNRLMERRLLGIGDAIRFS